jgi:hypothetical protein
MLRKRSTIARIESISFQDLSDASSFNLDFRLADAELSIIRQLILIVHLIWSETLTISYIFIDENQGFDHWCPHIGNRIPEQAINVFCP